MTPQALLCIPDARLRSLFSLLITDGDAQVTTCHDSDEFQRVIVTRYYDLCAITLDASRDLPALIKTVKNLSPGTRILLIASKDDVEQIIPLFPLGLSEVLLQPINPKRAIATIHQLLEAPAIEQPVPAGGDQEASQMSSVYRAQHLIVRSQAMRTMMNQLWQSRQDALGVILRGEPGSEFELVAREYQAMSGDPNGFLYVLGAHEITSEGLATAASLDRLNDGVPRMFLVRDVEALTASQQAQLLDFLRIAKRRRDRDRPLRFVFAVAECDEQGRNLELPFLEELLFVVPTVVKLPPLRERKADIEALARKLIWDLTAIHPDYRVRSIHSTALDWLGGRLWRGNYVEFCAYLRQVIVDCPSRELTMTYFTGRRISPSGGAQVVSSADAVVHPAMTPSLPVAKTDSMLRKELTGVRSEGRLSARQLLATLRA